MPCPYCGSATTQEQAKEPSRTNLNNRRTGLYYGDE